MSRILLIYPNPRGLFPRMPYPVLYLAGYLRERGIIADIFDLQVEDKKAIKFDQYDYFGFSLQFTGPQIRSALEVAGYLRSCGTKAPFIWGGIHSTITAVESIENEFVDYLVRGEGEECLYQLITSLDKGGDPKAVHGLTFKKDAKIINTADMEFVNLEEIPLLPYHLLSNKQAYSELKRKPSILSIGTSRGCPHNCGFCYVKSVHRHKWRAMSAERVIREIKNILKYFKPDIIMANDDYFFASLPRSRQIAQKIIDEKLNISWSGSMRFDSAAGIDDDFWKLLKKSGFVNPNFGGESGSTEILNLINKKISVGQMKKLVSNLIKYDFDIYSNYMLGLPQEKYSDIRKTFSLIKKLSKMNKRFFAGLSIYTPYPGTPLYPEALKVGFRAPVGLEDWADYQYNTVSNLPWLKGRIRSLVRTVSLFTHFSFNQPLNIKYSMPNKNIFYFLGFILLSLAARIRWVLNCFLLPLEWRLYEYILRVFRIQER